MALKIVISPEGRGRYSARLGNNRLCNSSSTPLLTAARVLLNEGVSPNIVITMTHEGASEVAMKATLGKAAKLTVVENDKEGPRLSKYRPLPSFEQAREAVTCQA